MLDALQGAFHDGLGYVAISYCLAAVGLNVQFGYAGRKMVFQAPAPVAKARPR